MAPRAAQDGEAAVLEAEEEVVAEAVAEGDASGRT